MLNNKPNVKHHNFRNLWDSPTVPPKLPLSRMQSRKMMGDKKETPKCKIDSGMLAISSEFGQ